MTQFAIATDGIKLAYERVGTGNPVLLVHGFASSRVQNWKSTGWFSTLTEAGFSVIAMDCRGHGDSDKPHEVQFYGHDRMADDAAAVLDAAGEAKAALVGYSMGGFIGLRFAARFGTRLTKLALGGVGEFYLRGPRLASEGSRNLIADALVTDDKASITDPKALVFRAFADQPGKDRFALAACMRAMSPQLPNETLSQLQTPILVVDGEQDDIAGAPGPLAAVFPHGQAVAIAGRDHMSAVGDRRTRQAVRDFL